MMGEAGGNMRRRGGATRQGREKRRRGREGGGGAGGCGSVAGRGTVALKARLVLCGVHVCVCKRHA